MIVRAAVLGLDLHLVPPVADLREHIAGAYDFAAMLPMQLDRLLKHYPAGPPIKKIILGGGPVSDQLAQGIQKTGIQVWHTYASTETCTHVAYRSISDNESRYRAAEGVSFETTASDCLIIHTPHLSTSPHVTKDVVELHDARTFTWLGRADNVVLSGGLKLYPEQLEQRCAALIDAPFYFGKEADAELGERLILFVEVGSNDPNGTVTTQQLQRTLHKHEMPKRIEFVDRFNRTETGKIRRSNW